MSTLAMFGFASSAAVEDEAALASAASVTDSGIVLDIENEQYNEFVFEGLTARTNYDYEINHHYSGTYIIQTFGVTGTRQRCALQLIKNVEGEDPVVVESSTTRADLKGWNIYSNFIVAELDDSSYTLRITPEYNNTTVRLSITYTDGFFVSGAPERYENYIETINQNGETEQEYQYCTEPAKVVLYEMPSSGQFAINGGSNAIVCAIDPTTQTYMDDGKYIGQSTIIVSGTPGTLFYIAYYPIPGDSEVPITITLNFENIEI